MTSVSSSQTQVRSGACRHQLLLRSHGPELTEPRLGLNSQANCRSWLKAADGAQERV